jgi:hypothetical protein
MAMSEKSRFIERVSMSMPGERSRKSSSIQRNSATSRPVSARTA